jgi:hypothetical protein
MCWVFSHATIFCNHLIHPKRRVWNVTNDDIRLFEAFFKGVSTRFGRRIIEQSIENLDFRKLCKMIQKIVACEGVVC